MPLRLQDLQDRYRASIVGFAVGDALGFPYRGLPPSQMHRALGMADDFAPRPRGRFAKGQFSDDTQLMLAIAESVAREKKIDGRSIGAHVAWLWNEGVVLQPNPAATHAAERLLGGTPWMSAGADFGMVDASCLSRGVVVGLWNDEISRLGHDASVATIVTHKDPLCAAAVAAFARAIQLGLADAPLDATPFCQQVSEAAAQCHAGLSQELAHLPRVLAWDPERALLALRKIGVPHSQLDTEPGIPVHVVPVLLLGVYAFLKAPHDFRAALNLLLTLGGEVDVTAAVCAALMGAHHGSNAIPLRLSKTVQYADEVLAAADRLFDARVEKLPVFSREAVAVVR